MMRSTQRFPRLVTSSLLLAAWACGGGEEAPPTEVVRPVATMVLGSAERRGLSFPGTVQASNRADLAFRVPGSLIQLPINEGEYVQRGQLLARLDPTDYDLTFLEAQATYDQAEANYIRYKRLYEREAVSLAELEGHRARRDVSKARMDQAAKNVSYTSLRAPFSGFIGRRFIENFEDVQAKEVIMSLQSVDTVEIVINVPERILALTSGREGLEMAATFPAAPAFEFPIWLKEVAAESDSRTQTFAVTFAMHQPDELNVLPGMTAEVWARQVMENLSQEDQSFLVPATAVFVSESGDPAVWVLENDETARLRTVEVGQLVAPDRIQVLDGVVAGERIAIAAVSQIRDGMTVRPMADN